MKVDIYIQKNRSALIVPSRSDVSNLSQAAQGLVSSAEGTKRDVDIDDPIIGLDRQKAKREFTTVGEFVSKVGNK